MLPNATPEVHAILDALKLGLRGIPGDGLLGLYLYGSLATGDFDPALSDIDLLAVTATALDARQFRFLEALHLRLAAHFPDWEDRIEVAYVSKDALQTFRTQASEIAVISPGERFHTKEAGLDWLVNWYAIQEEGITLLGLPASALIPPIAHAEYNEAIRRQAEAWREWVLHMHLRKQQAYSVLTLCRAFYSARFGRQASKARAAEWVRAELPDAAHMVDDALRWREQWRDDAVDHEATYERTITFVNMVIDRINLA